MPIKEIFNYAYELFKQKYTQFDDFARFLQDFDHHRIINNSNWYEGSHIWAPSTNSGTESLNGKIKVNYLDRTIVQISEFIKIAFDVFDEYLQIL